MLTEEKLPVQLKEIDCEKGCAKAVYRTVIKRDGVVIHTEYEYQEVKIEELDKLTAPIIVATNKAIELKKERLIIH